MQSTIQTNNGQLVASKWTEPKSRHNGKLLGAMRAPLLSSSLIFRRKKKKVHGSSTGPVDVDEVTDDDNGLLGAIRRRREVTASLKQKRESLPSHGYYSSNHIMINNDRIAFKRLPLIRRRDLDDKARTHAREMANAERLFYSDPWISANTTERVGECIARNTNVRDAHCFFRGEKYDRRNMLEPEFKHMGTGTAWDKKGTQLYVCYLFEG